MSDGTARRRPAQPPGYAEELTAFRQMLAEADVVGWPKRDAELAELERLVAKYPAEARQFLDPPGAAQ